MSGTDHGVRVVCFDLGGVVVRIARSWVEACAAAGIENRTDDSFRAPNLLSGRRELSDAYQVGDIDCATYFERVSSRSAGLYLPEEVEAVHRAWVFDSYPGVERLVDDLNGCDGVTTACLSNTNHSHWQDLQRDIGGAWAAPAIQKLSIRLVSHELRAVKPDAKIYSLAEQHLGAAAEQIVFFDDLMENVEAAIAQGWRAFCIDHAGDTAAQMRTHLVDLGVL